MAPALRVGVGDGVAHRVMLRAGISSLLIQAMASGAKSGPPKLLGPQTLPIRDSGAAKAQLGPHRAPWHFSWQRGVWEESGLARPWSPAWTTALGAVV